MQHTTTLARPTHLTSAVRFFALIAMLASLALCRAWAVVPPESEESLARRSTHVLTGTVIQSDVTSASDQYYTNISVTAKLAVESIEKGDDIAAGDEVDFRYSFRIEKPNNDPENPTPVGGGNPHIYTVSTGCKVRIFAQGSKGKSFSIVMPNGIKLQ